MSAPSPSVSDRASREAPPRRCGTLDLDRVDAVLFDLDGVITDTARIHAAAWKRTFDSYLAERAKRTGERHDPFDISRDYPRHVDGRPRHDGAEAFLRSRGISLPAGNPDDPPGRETVHGVGNRKNVEFQRQLAEHGAESFPATVALLRSLRARGARTAVFSASRNCLPVLRAAGVADLFDARVDGVDAAEQGLAGKPDPAIIAEAARRLGIAPERAAVVEDALAGVEAGSRGGFALVVGVDRAGHAEELRSAGADVVVESLSELQIEGGSAPRIRDLPDASGREREILALVGPEPALFLDYDGTLTPIVEDPERADLAPGMRDAIARAAGALTLAVVSGRDLADVRRRVGVDGIWYAGSHGLDLTGPDGQRLQPARDFLPALDRAQRALESGLAEVPGARTERKRFSIAAHWREVDDEDVGRVEAVVDRAAEETGRLRKTHGKRVFELRPDIDWDKGRALAHLMDELGVPPERALYIGDDVTDEDAFAALGPGGLGIAVRGEDDGRTTSADYSLADPGAVQGFLAAICEAVEGATDADA